MKNIAIKAIKVAGKILRKKFQETHSVKYKGSQQSIVTDADLASQKMIIDIIKKEFPNHEILSEEAKNNTSPKAEYLWIIDPLDGTANYASGNPYFSVAIALQRYGKTILGATYAPITKELFVAEKGKGAFYNGKKIVISETKTFRNAVVCVDWNHCKNKNREKMKDVLYNVGKEARRVLSYGSGVLAASHVSIGVFDAYFNIQSHPWDHAAASLIVQEAGGVATTIDGKGQKGLTDSVLVSNNRRIYNSLFDLLK